MISQIALCESKLGGALGGRGSNLSLIQSEVRHTRGLVPLILTILQISNCTASVGGAIYIVEGARLLSVGSQVRSVFELKSCGNW